jgi:transcriptional regulator with XRE-family HTH domain
LSHFQDVRLPPRVILGRNVCRLRQQADMTQEDLAEGAEIDRRYVQRIEAGTANPGFDIVARLRAALKCSWDELLKGIR